MGFLATHPSFIIFTVGIVLSTSVQSAVGDVYFCNTKHIYHVWSEGRVTKGDSTEVFFKIKRNENSITIKDSYGNDMEYLIFEGRDPAVYRQDPEHFYAQSWDNVFVLDFRNFTHTMPAGGEGVTIHMGVCDIFK